MKIIKQVGVEDMVASFLKAEFNSLRWKKKVITVLKKYDINESLILNPDLSNLKENVLRSGILGELRGYKRNKNLFENFPKKCKVV